MLRITPQLNADAAKKYQAQHLSKGDYYLSESENYGRWQGQGAEMLGLKEGSVISKKDYDRLCENKRNFHPAKTPRSEWSSWAVQSACHFP